MWAGTTLSPLSRRVSRADSSVGRNINRPVEEKPLLDEIREVLAQSYLIFLFADLRQMSATGRIGTKYENLAIDNDVCSRHTAKCIACMEDSLEIHEHKKRFSGLSSAVIMAIVILEIRDTFVKTAEENKETGKKGTKKFKFATSVDIDNDDDFVAYENNDLKKKMTEESMESLMRCYSRMISEDLVTDIPNRKRISKGSSSDSNPRETDKLLSTPTGHNPGEGKASFFPQAALTSVQEDKFDGEVGIEMQQLSDDAFDVVTADEKGVTSSTSRTGGTGVLIRDETGSDNADTSRKSAMQLFSPSKWQRTSISGEREGNPLFETSLRDHIKNTRENSKQIADKLKADFNDQVDNLLPTNREANTQKEFEELTNIFFDQGEANEEVKSSLGASYSRKEMVDVMRTAVETRSDSKLQFLSKLFKDGSISRLLVESEARVVWMNDWYPLKDLTYVISVDKLQRRVMVVFRGAITTQDWKSSFNFRFRSIQNPVKENYEGKKKSLRVFSGLYTYLFRKRKDTGTTKYDEIANMVHKYGMEHIGQDYKLFVTGYSLGGALTHFFCFQASTDQRFTKNGPVKAIAFASPYIGGHSWADAIRHQERSKKLQFVQCRNNSDFVPRFPANFRIGKRGPLWRHVGIGVTLPRVPECWGSWKPSVHYWGKEKSCLDSTIHGYRRNFLFHFSYLRPWTLHRSHTLLELQDRLMYGERHSTAGGDFELLRCTLDDLYDKLQEHDFQTFRKTKRWWDEKRLFKGEPETEE